MRIIIIIPVPLTVDGHNHKFEQAMFVLILEDFFFSLSFFVFLSRHYLFCSMQEEYADRHTDGSDLRLMQLSVHKRYQIIQL